MSAAPTAQTLSPSLSDLDLGLSFNVDHNPHPDFDPGVDFGLGLGLNLPRRAITAYSHGASEREAGAPAPAMGGDVAK